jgi:hypothetical protein
MNVVRKSRANHRAACHNGTATATLAAAGAGFKWLVESRGKASFSPAGRAPPSPARTATAWRSRAAVGNDAWGPRQGRRLASSEANGQPSIALAAGGTGTQLGDVRDGDQGPVELHVLTDAGHHVRRLRRRPRCAARGGAVAPNILRVLQNAYVTTGKAIKKRPCLQEATLEAGTVGLKAFGGKLNTFYGAGRGDHARGHALRGAPRAALDHGRRADQDPLLRPVQRIDVRRGGVRGGLSAPLPRRPGRMGGAHGLRGGVFAGRRRRERLSLRGDDAAAAPRAASPLADDDRRDGGRRHGDVDLPHVRHHGHELPAHEAGGEAGAEDLRGRHRRTTVRYCKTGDPRDWTTASDAGFIAAGLYARGSDQVTAIGPLLEQVARDLLQRQRAAVGGRPEPGEHRRSRRTSRASGRSTTAPRARCRSTSSSSRRTAFARACRSRRSRTTCRTTTSAARSTSSSRRRSLDDRRPAQRSTTRSSGSSGASTARRSWAYTFSRTAKISAWSKFTFPFTIDDACGAESGALRAHGRRRLPGERHRLTRTASARSRSSTCRCSTRTARSPACSSSSPAWT